MKRFISLVTAITMLLTLVLCNVPTSYAAKEQLEFVLTNGAALNNEEFTIDLELRNNPGIYAYYFLLYYDADTFILRDFALSDSFASMGSLTTSEANRDADYFADGLITGRIIESFPSYGVDTENLHMILLMYEIDSITENCELNGTSITFTFQAMGIAEPGNHIIGLVPDAESMINIDGDEVPFKMTNSIVTVGSTTVPEETEPSFGHNETEKVETTETTANDIVLISPDETVPNETVPNETVTAPAETFQGEDGKVYYENENGETVEYNEEDFTTPAETKDSTSSSDVAVDSEAINEQQKQEKKNNNILYIIIAAILVLAGAAGILIVFIVKTKKDDGSEAKAEEKPEAEETDDENN